MKHTLRFTTIFVFIAFWLVLQSASYAQTDKLEAIVVLENVQLTARRIPDPPQGVNAKRIVDADQPQNSTVRFSLFGAATGFIKLQNNTYPDDLWQQLDIDHLEVDFEIEAELREENSGIATYTAVRKTGFVIFNGSILAHNFGSNTIWEFKDRRDSDIQIAGGTIEYSQTEDRVTLIEFAIPSGNDVYPQTQHILFDGNEIIATVAFEPFPDLWWFHDPFNVVNIPGAVAETNIPRAFFTIFPQNPLINEEITFNASESLPGGEPILHYLWDFGDGTTGTGPIGTHAYSEKATYTVTLTVIDEAGLTSIYSQKVTAREFGDRFPSAAFIYSPFTPTPGQEILFDASGSTGANSEIVKYSWDFGDGATASGVEVSHTFAGNQAYVVTLTIEDNEGQTNKVERIIEPGTTPAVLHGILLDRELKKDSIDQPPLQGILVELDDASGTHLTQTSAKGEFLFTGINTNADLILKVSHNNDTGYFVKTYEGLATGVNHNVLFPISFFDQKYSLIEELEALTVDYHFLGSSRSASVFLSYNESEVRPLLTSWITDSKSFDNKDVESLFRLLLAERVVSDIFDDATTLSVETTEAIVGLVWSNISIISAFGTSANFINGIINTSELLDTLILMSSQLLITVPFEYLKSIIPASQFDVIDEITQASLSVGFSDPLTFFEDQTTRFSANIASKTVLPVYVLATQPVLYEAINKAVKNDFSGDEQSAMLFSNALVDVSSSETSLIVAKANEAQLNAAISSMLADLSVLGGLASPVFIPIAITLKGLAVTQYSLSIGNTAGQLWKTAATNLPNAVSQAFHPGGSNVPAKEPVYMPGTAANHNKASLSTAQSSQYQFQLQQSISDYENTLKNIVNLSANGQREEALNLTDDLLLLESELSEAMHVSQSQIYGAAEESYQSLDSFEENYIQMGNAVTESIANRLVLYSQLLNYSFDEAYAPDSLAHWADSVHISLDEAQSAISETTTLVADVETPPVLIVKSHEAQGIDGNISINSTVSIEATVKNVTGLPAEQITVTLVPDSSAFLTGEASFSLDQLNPDEEKSFSWKILVVDTTHAHSSYQVQIQSSNAKAFSATGIFAISSEALPTSHEDEPDIKSDFALHQNYPNPFSGTSVIAYDLAAPSNVVLSVYDVLGREVTRLVDALQLAGRHEVVFDAQHLSDGTYLYRLESGEFRESHILTIRN